jgi:hypothetical protein
VNEDGIKKLSNEIDLTEVLTDVRQVINRLKSKTAELGWIRNELRTQGVLGTNGHRENSTYEMLKLFIKDKAQPLTQDELVAQLTDETKEKLFQEVFVQFAEWKHGTRNKPRVPRHWNSYSLQIPETDIEFFDRDDELWFSADEGYILVSDINPDGNNIADYKQWNDIKKYGPFVERVQ